MIYLLHLNDIADVLVVTLIIYLVLVFIKETKSFAIFGAVVFLAGISYVAKNFDLSLTRQLFQPLLTFFLVIFVVVFQKEIRRFFDWFVIPSRRHFLQSRAESLTAETARLIAAAVKEMARRQFGALIVLAGDYPLDDLVQGGFALGGRISTPLLLSIFDPSSPGHDGAVVIEGNRLRRFGAHLPLSENIQQINEAGTRHRAALGLVERSDALVIVVSEERGTVSWAQGPMPDGGLRALGGSSELAKLIAHFYHDEPNQDFHWWYYLFIKNWPIKVLSLGLAMLLRIFWV